MKPSERIRQQVESFASQHPGENPLPVMIQVLINELDREHIERMETERRLLELGLVALVKSGDRIPQDWLFALQDLRGKSRLDPKDPLLAELMQVLVEREVQERNAAALAQREAEKAQPSPPVDPLLVDP